MQQIPVYAFTGFLDSGKTKFIQETLEDPRFNAGERTLVLIFEEGEEEYDLSTYPKKNVYLEVLDQQTVTTEELKALQKKYKAERVVAELNGMQQVGDLYMRCPDSWAIAQEVMFADATTFMTYNANMRNLVMDKLMGAQMVVFNRMAPGQDVMPFHKLARAANRRIDILYDYTDGTTKFDEIEDPLPFDINAPVIEIKDEDYALWYRDVSEEPQKYDGKTVHFKGQVAMLRRDKNGMFAPGRFVMTCCVEDIQFCGIPCRYAGAGSLESRSWVWVTAKIGAEKHPLYKGDVGPVLTAISVETGAEPADPDVATF
ncbi:MAG: GTP-binding protein [Eubacteriales bacterium]|nr:GTP-binding protein [Eubacteriales bacterium]